MKNARRVLAGCYILISVFTFLSLGGCEHWGWRDRDDHHGNYDDRDHHDNRGDRDDNAHHEENHGENH